MFNGIWLVAAEPLTVGGRTYRPGERFHLSRVHSGALLATGRATIAHPQPPPKAPALPAPPVMRRRGRPRKTAAPEAPEAPAAPVVPETPVTPETLAIVERPDGVDPVVEPTERAESVDESSRLYRRRDLEAEE